VATVFNLVKSMVGAGILTAPFLFRLNGVFLSLIICLGVGFSMFITVRRISRRLPVNFALQLKQRIYPRIPQASVLVTVADWYGVSTYEDTLAKIFGRAGAIVLDICTVFRGIGSLIAYMIIIKDVASGLLADAGLGREHAALCNIFILRSDPYSSFATHFSAIALWCAVYW